MCGATADCVLWQVMEVLSDTKQGWFEWLMREGSMGMLDIDFVQADKYKPTAAPIFADMASSWAGRSAQSLLAT